jgi:hypothetical protein
VPLPDKAWTADSTALTIAAMTWRGSAARMVVVTLTVISVGAACSGESQSPPPKALSVQEYASTLAGALGPLESNLKHLAKAKVYKGLEGQLTHVETAAAQAVTTLTPITPPPELAAEHAKLVTAMKAFQDEAGDASSQVVDRALCTGSAARAGLGNADQTSALRDAVAAVSAKLPKQVTLALPAAGQKVDSRLPNGKLISARNLTGRGELTIDNGGSSDAVLTLSKGKKPTLSVYVRKDKKYTVKGVPDGTYAVFFTGGTGWDGKARAFGRKCAFQRFEQPAKFSTTKVGIQTQYTVATLTLNPVAGGNAPTAQVDPNDFPTT